jgi:hypothetical protein
LKQRLGTFEQIEDETKDLLGLTHPDIFSRPDRRLILRLEPETPAMTDPNPPDRRSGDFLKGTHLHLELPIEVVSSLNNLMMHSGDSPGELFRKALALYKLGIEAKDEDNRLAVVGSDDEIVQEIVGL